MSDQILSIRSSPAVNEPAAATTAPEATVALSPENESDTADKTLLPFEAKKKHLLWIWIPVVIGLGLLIAAGYVGGRILTSKSHDSAPAVVITPVAQNTAAPSIAQMSTVQTASAQAAPAVKTPAPAETPKPDPSASQVGIQGDLDVIDPQPGERYIQISALNTEAAHRYVAELRHGPLEPHLAPGPRENLLRVLIGPFSDTSLLLTTRSDLMSAGIDCFIRAY